MGSVNRLLSTRGLYDGTWKQNRRNKTGAKIMTKYDRVVGTFFRKVAKLERIAERNQRKMEKLAGKAAKVSARIDAKIAKLMDKNVALDAEAAKCKKTAGKISELLS
jgi:hypothetical protein